MDLSIALACIGAGISFYGVLQYINGILHRGTKPRMASWVAWLTANSIFMVIAPAARERPASKPADARLAAAAGHQSGRGGSGAVVRGVWLFRPVRGVTLW